jgi:hypothetical protein
MINSVLERQAKSTDELLRRLVEEWDGKKLDATSANHSSSTCAVCFTQTNPHIIGLSMGSTSVPNPFAHLVNHFHSRTTIEGSAPTFWMPQQTTTSIFRQGYTHTASSFSMPNTGSTPYTSRYNGQAHYNSNGNYQASYTTVSYNDPIPLLGSSLRFLPNHAYQNMPCFNTYG